MLLITVLPLSPKDDITAPSADHFIYVCEMYPEVEARENEWNDQDEYNQRQLYFLFGLLDFIIESALSSFNNAHSI